MGTVHALVKMAMDQIIQNEFPGNSLSSVIGKVVNHLFIIKQVSRYLKVLRGLTLDRKLNKAPLMMSKWTPAEIMTKDLSLNQNLTLTLHESLPGWDYA